jgi:5-methylcytosine-specific restriction protein A
MPSCGPPAYARARDCGAKLMPGKFHYDHDIADGLGGEPELWNCKVLCHACHGVKTAKHDIPLIAKTKRISDREKGIKPPRKMTRWRRFDGSIREAGRER